MNLTRRSLLALGGTAALVACQRRREEKPAEKPEPDQTPAPEEPEATEEPEVDLEEFEALVPDMGAWSYDEVGGCYYQLGLPYCLNPGSEQYGTLAIFVPAAYFTATRHGRRYECVVNEEATVGGYTARTAPVALPVNARSYAAQECPASYGYEGLDRYLEAGIVYVYAGFRGRSGGYESTTQEYFSGGAPWPVADLKAVVRWLRYNAAVLPGDAERIYAFGQGAGGGLVAVLGTSGDAASFDPYLAELGAATHDATGAALGDGVFGVAAWCPLVSLGAADAAYEWMMGQYASDGTRASGTWTRLLSRDLSEAYGSYVNGLGLVDEQGTALTLDRIDDGSFGGGSYYAHLVGIVAEAAGDFFGRTEFPYTVVPPTGVARDFPGNPDLDVPAGTDDAADHASDERGEEATTGVRQVQATVYDTLESYVSSLNGEDRWLTYNASTGAVDVTGLWGFVESCRPATAGVCAYDALDRSGYANQLFGTDEQTSLHFDAMVAELVRKRESRYAKRKDWDESLVAASRGDLVETDAADLTVTDRVAMMDPLHHLLGEDDAPTSVAAHWRVNTGLFQSETTLAGEVNLVCALQAHEGVEDVAFEPVWGAGLGLAERSGDAQDNLVAWIVETCPTEAAETAEADEENS